jgi:hypothetical protein
MEIVQQIIKWVSNPANVQSVLAVLGSVYTIALFIVKLTPTQKDDEILGKIYGFIHGAIGTLGIKK